MEQSTIVIPKGWTYFAHRTNTSKWANNPFESNTITTNKIMSVVTEKEIYEEISQYSKKHKQGYSFGKGEPFEIRCLICDLPYLNSLDKESPLKKAMLSEFYYDRRNIGGCYGQRHHSIPPNEKLVVVGIGEYDEVYKQDKKIIWTIPERFIDFYKEAISKEDIRLISLNKPEELNNIIDL